jgi:hypothetical protein
VTRAAVATGSATSRHITTPTTTPTTTTPPTTTPPTTMTPTTQAPIALADHTSTGRARTSTDSLFTAPLSTDQGAVV